MANHAPRRTEHLKTTGPKIVPKLHIGINTLIIPFA